jgi:IMP dehydrogenase/GMP reductase
MWTFDNVTLVPRKKSTKEHRSACDTSTELCGIKLEVPLISSPMPDVTGGEMAGTLISLGAFGIIHRVQTWIEQANEYLKVQAGACAIGVTDDFEERFEMLYANGCRIFCLDTANGFNIKTEEAFNLLKPKYQDTYFIAGNVATAEGYAFLWSLGVDAIRVGIAGGSVCETKTETGVHMPTLESIREIAKFRWKAGRALDRGPAIIADGGIRIPADANKAIAAGANAVMCGNVFAGTEETPGSVIKVEDKLYKLYRGAASFSVQQENGKEPANKEGKESLVPYKGSVVKIVKRFKEGLQSSMSYMDAGNLQEFRGNASIEEL